MSASSAFICPNDQAQTFLCVTFGNVEMGPRRESPAYYDRLMHECYRGGLKSPHVVQESVNEATILSLVSCRLTQEGWFVFHDVPCDGATGKFNLDHVAVGPGGIWVVETKTRRKGRARPGFKEYEVTFDGNQIIWPWGEDRSALRQASANADWLKEWLKQMTGQCYHVSAVLTFPGYSVTERKLSSVRLANPKVLAQVLQGRGKTILDRTAIDLVRRQLDAKCRDVEY